MQATFRFRQARPRKQPIQTIRTVRHSARYLGAVAGELLALTSLVLALAAGLITLTGLIG